MANAWICPSGTSNWSGATWQQADSTSFLNSEAAFTNSTTSFVSSSTFTPGVVTIDGIGVKVEAVFATPSGTFSVQLAIAGVAVTGTTVTCNVSDLPANPGALSGGNVRQDYWVFMKFAAPVTLVAATVYTLQMKTSVTGMVALASSATTNWTRFLRTTTTGTPVAGDSLIITGEITAAATTAVNTLTHDSTATTQFLNCEVGAFGAWTWNNSASTAYYVSMTGFCYIGAGTLTIPSMPSTSSATFQFPQTGGSAASACFFRYASKIRLTGATKTISTVLNANASAGATSITTLASTSWASGDDIAIASTTTTVAQTERVTMSGPASGTSVPVPALSFAHGGVSPIIGEVVNLTRNIIFIGASTTNTFYLFIHSQDYQIQYVQFSNVGSGTVYKQALNFSSTPGINTNLFNYCVAKDVQASATVFNFNTTTSTDNFNSTGCISYGGASSLFAAGTVTGAIVFNSFYSFYATGNAIADTAPNVTYNGVTVISSTGTSGFTPGTARSAAYLTNLTAHSNGSYMNIGVSGTPGPVQTLVSNVTAWRNQYGMVFTTAFSNANIDTATLFGNTTANLYLGSSLDTVTLSNFNIQAGTTSVCPTGTTWNTANYNRVFLDNFLVGTVNTHSTGDVVLAGGCAGAICFRNSTFGSSTLISGQSTLSAVGAVLFQRFGGTAGVNRLYGLTGTAFTDAVIFDTSPYSQRLTPSSATSKLNGTSFIIPIGTNNTFTVTVKLRTSSTGAGDATTYNGNAPRLILKSNAAAGSTYNAYIIAATAASSPGNWQSLTYTIPSAVTDNTALEFYIDCDGTTGWINWDTVTLS